MYYRTYNTFCNPDRAPVTLEFEAKELSKTKVLVEGIFDLYRVVTTRPITTFDQTPQELWQVTAKWLEETKQASRVTCTKVTVTPTGNAGQFSYTPKTSGITAMRDFHMNALEASRTAEWLSVRLAMDPLANSNRFEFQFRPCGIGLGISIIDRNNKEEISVTDVDSW